MTTDRVDVRARVTGRDWFDVRGRVRVRVSVDARVSVRVRARVTVMVLVVVIVTDTDTVIGIVRARVLIWDTPTTEVNWHPRAPLPPSSALLYLLHLPSSASLIYLHLPLSSASASNSSPTPIVWHTLYMTVPN